MSHENAPQSDGQATSARPHRPTSTEHVDDRTDAPHPFESFQIRTDAHKERVRLLNLAESHAHEADRLADQSRDAGTIHARLAQFWLDLAKEQS